MDLELFIVIYLLFIINFIAFSEYKKDCLNTNNIYNPTIILNSKTLPFCQGNRQKTGKTGIIGLLLPIMANFNFLRPNGIVIVVTNMCK